MKHLVLIFIGILSFQLINARGNKYLLAGIGNYETLFGGVNKTYPSNIYFETGLGINPIRPSYQMFYVSGGKLFKGNKQWPFVIGMQVKALVWHVNNRYNQFIIFSPNPELRITKNIKNIKCALNLGYLYNTPLLYKRKTSLEVGWPYEWQPSFSFQLMYKLP